METLINSSTYISIGLGLSCLGVVYTFGTQKQRIDDLADRMKAHENHKTDITTMKEQVKQLTVTLTEVRNDVRDIKNNQT